MSSQHNQGLSELELLLESLCEGRINSEQIARLEQLVLSSDAARWKYLQYLDLHGTLYWDAGGVGSAQPLSSETISIVSTFVAPGGAKTPKSAVAERRSWRYAGVTIVACLLLAVALAFQFTDRHREEPNIAKSEKTSNEQLPSPNPPVRHVREFGPAVVLSPAHETNTGVANDASSAVDVTNVPAATERVAALMSDADVVAAIDREIQSGWTAVGVRPSDVADDSEWCRRVYLDLLGRVPTLTEVERFLAEKKNLKRSELVDRLLAETEYVRNLTTKWTNLLIGRVSNPNVDRAAFQKFLRTSFAENRPWNRIVADLISAEGDNSQNGATNFLIAHLNNDATPATAVASRVLLGRQLQCNQCHNNPYDETKQSEFWELNCFFHQTIVRSRQPAAGDAGKPMTQVVELVDQDVSGPVYFETTNGLMRVAYPRFHGVDVTPRPEASLRVELAQLMTQGDQPELASAFVNRMWEHFFGAAFTYRADDLGPHQPTSHPELLTLLSNQFIRSGYDVKQLVRWICQSQPYQLTSRFSDANHSDDPARGELPAFSRMYVKSMTAEQAYDSFLTATKAHEVGSVDWTQAEQHRQEWLKQFVVSFGTDDNEESMSFDGTVGNALSLMNGPLINKALEVSSGSFLSDVLKRYSSDNDKIRALWLGVLSRPPSTNEFATARKLLRGTQASQVAGRKTSEVYQDLMWALLNSNEFIAVR